MVGGLGTMMSGFGVAGIWILWFLGIVLLAWMIAGMSRREEQPVLSRISTVEDVLHERLARGEISTREFEEALQQLRDS